MTAAGALTEPDVVALRAEVTTGRPVTVWFTPAAVGVPAGGSAKVVSVGEPAEGDFIQVRAAGTRDTMFCSPGELTRTRPTRRRGAAAEDPAPSPTVSAARAKPVRKAPAPAAAAVPAPAAAVAPAAPAPAPAGSERKPARARRRSDPTGEMSVSMTATADGEWTVEVRVGTKRIVTALPVPAADVATAARSLPTAVAEAIEASLDGARQRQRDRVEQLRAELDAAQQVLDQLGI